MFWLFSKFATQWANSPIFCAKQSKPKTVVVEELYIQLLELWNQYALSTCWNIHTGIFAPDMKQLFHPPFCAGRQSLRRSFRFFGDCGHMWYFEAKDTFPISTFKNRRKWQMTATISQKTSAMVLCPDLVRRKAGTCSQRRKSAQSEVPLNTGKMMCFAPQSFRQLCLYHLPSCLPPATSRSCHWCAPEKPTRWRMRLRGIFFFFETYHKLPRVLPAERSRTPHLTGFQAEFTIGYLKRRHIKRTTIQVTVLICRYVNNHRWISHFYSTYFSVLDSLTVGRSSVLFLLQ